MAVGTGTALAVGAGANLLGGYLGDQAAKGDRQRSLDILNNIYNQYANLTPPSIESQQISPEAYTLAGMLTPGQESPEALAARTALQDIQLDPRLQKTQMDSLQMLQKIAQSKGMTPEDKASLQLAMNKVEADNQARQQALLQQQEARGVGSSDMATAMRSQQAQSSANRAAEMALANQVEGRRRALEAMSGSADLARQMEQAQYGREAAVAGQLDTRDIANVQARNQAQQRNIQAQNAAQEFNLRNMQNVGQQNVATRNLAQEKNKGLVQQQFQNQLQRLQGMGGQAQPLAVMHQLAGKQKGQGVVNMAGGIGSMLTGLMKPQKDDVEAQG